MKLVKKILDRFNGLQYPQEYLCFARGFFYQPLHVYLVGSNEVIKEVTQQHLFVGYCPLVFAFSGPGWGSSIQLVFTHQLLKPNEFYSEKDALAWLEMKQVKEQFNNESHVVYYEGTHGSHHFIPDFNQYLNKLNNKWYNKKPGNVFLHDNLYRQVQIAYAVPRNISLISIQQGEFYNLFPTDLHGQIDENHYIISLRTGGKALEQVKKAGKLLLSQVQAEAYQMVYNLGKNHMQEPKPKENFPFSSLLSQNLLWPLPQHAISYRELVLLEGFEQGIHTILLFRIGFSHPGANEKNSLAHIHNSYASWRYKNGLAGNFLLR